MILYFADRKMNIIGKASTNLPRGLIISNDKKTEEVDNGSVTLEFDMGYSGKEGRAKAERLTAPGNYVLRRDGQDFEFYTIIDSEYDTDAGIANVYSEDAGLDLLNEVLGPYEAATAMPVAQYVSIFTQDSGFEIGHNEISGLSRKLKWEGEATATERLLSLAAQFDAELSFSFEIDKLRITHKYINFWKKRGKDIGVTLRIGEHISRIRIKKSVANIATALSVTGGTPQGKNTPVTLSGYKYDDGDIYVSGKLLKSRSALALWSRYLSPDEKGTGEGHIVKQWSYDTTVQSTLCARAVTQLRKISKPEVNYEVDVKVLPDQLKIGDTCRIVDSEGNLFLEARLLKLVRSVANGTCEATFGDYLIKPSGISDTVSALAKDFAELARNRTLYTWIVYADDEEGTGISLSPDGKKYMGTSGNRLEETPDLTDPTIYSWSKVQGEDATVLRIDSSRGVLFKNNVFATVLTVTITKGALIISDVSAMKAEYGSGAFLQWYWRKSDDDDWKVMLVTDSHITNGGFRLDITPDDVDEKIVFKCELEV